MTGSIISKSKSQESETLGPLNGSPGTEDFAHGEVIVPQTALGASIGPFSAEELTVAYEQYAPGTEAEKRLVRKIDLLLLPMLWLMCVMAYVDRNNIVRRIPTIDHEKILAISLTLAHIF